MIKKIYLILLCGFFLCCGKKAPPHLTKSRLPFRVILLKAKKKDDIWVLEGEIAGKKKGYKISDIVGCRIYYSRYSFDNPPCESCPIYYGRYKDIKADVVKDGHFSCRLAWIKKKGIYYLKIRLIGKNNSVGPFSERIKIEVRKQ